MTPEEVERGIELHERRLARIEDNLLVQGQLLDRLDRNVERLAAVVEKNSTDMHIMQSAMTSLFQRMEAFLRGLERHDGQENPGSA